MKIRALLAAIGVASGMITATVLAAPTASPDPCVGSWSLGIGGFEWGGGQNSAYFTVNQHVGYNSWDPNSGVNELNRLFWDHRNQCPGDHIKILGHSEGAALVHHWVTHNQWVENANAVLLADPKRWAPWTGSGPGITYDKGWLGAPLAGVDDWFGGFPVLTLCRWDDVICNVNNDWGPYFAGHHGWYDFNAWNYGDWDSGAWML